MGNLIFGAVCIVGGISGTLALRGTGSPIALAVVGVVFAILGVFQLSSGGKAKSRKTTRRTIGGRPPRRR